MKLESLSEKLRSNPYPGRGIVIGKTPDGKRAVCAYFIMGRSVNSRNRIFAEESEGIRTEAYDPSKLVDPSLIIYAPVRVFGTRTIVTNGDQTDTVYDGLAAGKSFEQALETREFEPDVPNYTPRISGVIELDKGAFSYKMSILKSADGNPSCCNRYMFSYDKPIAGEGRFLHTYAHDVSLYKRSTETGVSMDAHTRQAAWRAHAQRSECTELLQGFSYTCKGGGEPLQSFEGEPLRIAVGDEDIDGFAEMIWESLNEDNKVSLFVRFIDIQTGEYESRIINRNM